MNNKTFKGLTLQTYSQGGDPIQGTTGNTVIENIREIERNLFNATIYEITIEAEDGHSDNNTAAGVNTKEKIDIEKIKIEEAEIEKIIEEELRKIKEENLLELLRSHQRAKPKAYIDYIKAAHKKGGAKRIKIIKRYIVRAGIIETIKLNTLAELNELETNILFKIIKGEPITKAAQSLKVSRPTYYKKMKEILEKLEEELKKIKERND